MAQVQVQLLNAICKNKDVHVILGEDAQVFGSYQPEFEMVRDYYNQFRQPPSIEVVHERFPDIDIVDTHAESVYYLEQLRTSYLEAKLGELLKNAATAIDKERPAARVLENIQTTVATLSKYVGGPQDVDLTDLDHIKEHLAEVRKIAEDNDGVAGLSTGIAAWDSAYTTGLAPGNVCTLFGYSGKMKSMVAAYLANHFHDEGHKVMYINLEMNPDEQTERLIALKAKGLFSMTDWSRGDINEDDLDEWARKNLTGSPSFKMITTQGITEVTPNFIQGKIEKYKPDVVFLDYLQLMSDNAKSSQLTPRMMNLSGEIKQLATANNIPIVQIAAVGDEENDKRDQAPQIKQISWSKGIEFNSNLAVAIHLHNDSGMIEVACRKNRRGPLFNFLLDASQIDRGIIKEVYDV
jgi:replicative DNA helicase